MFDPCSPYPWLTLSAGDHKQDLMAWYHPFRTEHYVDRSRSLGRRQFYVAAHLELVGRYRGIGSDVSFCRDLLQRRECYLFCDAYGVWEAHRSQLGSMGAKRYKHDIELEARYCWFCACHVRCRGANDHWRWHKRREREVEHAYNL